jgi:hypothetical protein
VGGLGLSSLPPPPPPPDVGSDWRGDAAAAAMDGSWNLRLQYFARIQASSTLHKKWKYINIETQSIITIIYLFIYLNKRIKKERETMN